MSDGKKSTGGAANGPAGSAGGVTPGQAAKMTEVLNAFPSMRLQHKTGDSKIVLSIRVRKRAKEWLRKARAAMKDKKSTVEFIHRMSVDDFNDIFVDPDEDFVEPPEQAAYEAPPSGKSANKAPSSGKSTSDNQKAEGFMRNPKPAPEQPQNPMSGFAEGMGSMMGSLFAPMMQNIYSKEMLYPTSKAAADAYPSYLEENRKSLSKADLTRYTKQHEIYSKVVAIFDHESEYDDPETKSANKNKIMFLMTELQKHGDPPEQIREIQAENQPDMEKTMESVFAGFGNMFGGMANQQGADGDDDAQCCIQ